MKNIESTGVKKEYIPYDQIVLYFKLMKSGQKEYRNLIIINYLDFASNIARNFRNIPNYAIIEDDLIEESHIGLVKAVDTYDIDKKNLFLTYASTVIKNQILMYLRKIKKYTREDYSINSVVGYGNNDKEHELIDTICDENINILDDYLEKEKIQDLYLALETLDEKKRDIIKKYFGIGCYPLGQCQIGEIYGYSQSHISRILKSSIKQMKIYYLKRQK